MVVSNCKFASEREFYYEAEIDLMGHIWFSRNTEIGENAELTSCRQVGKQKHDRHARGGDNGMGNEIGNSASFQEYNIVSNPEFYFIFNKKIY